MHVRCEAGGGHQTSELSIDEGRIATMCLVRCKVNQRNLGQQRINQYRRPIEIIERTCDLTAHKSRILAIVSGTIDPFQDFSCVSEQPNVRAAVYPQLVQICAFIKKRSKATKRGWVLRSTCGGVLGKLGIIAPRALVRGRLPVDTVFALLSNEQTASSLSERTVWQVIPATPLERVSFIAQARATEEQEITG